MPANNGKQVSFRFQSTHPARGGTGMRAEAERIEQFQSTHPARGGTHAPRRADGRGRFQSTHPARGGTAGGKVYFTSGDISIHPPREGWDSRAERFDRDRAISIHPPREGWDEAGRELGRNAEISIHPPREGWDGGADSGGRDEPDFNPPTPRGVGLVLPRAPGLFGMYFNPPTPRGVGQTVTEHNVKLFRFQSTHPARGGTAKVYRSHPVSCAKQFMFRICIPHLPFLFLFEGLKIMVWQRVRGANRPKNV